MARVLGHLARRSRGLSSECSPTLTKWQGFNIWENFKAAAEAPWDLSGTLASPRLGASFSSQTRNFLSSSNANGVKQAGNGLDGNVMERRSTERFGDVCGFHRLDFVRGFVQLRTNLEVADNSGARRVQCIKVMKGSNAAKIGDIIMASVKEAQPRGKVKKGDVVTCVVVRAATQKLRRDGSEIKFDKNAVVLVNKQGDPIGTRIFGPVPHELRRRKMVKILTLADNVA